MLTHLLDTSVYCQPIRPVPHPGVVARWVSLGDDRLAISALCEAEALFGIGLKGSTRLQKAYDKLLRGRLQVLPVDEAVAAAYAQLRVSSARRGRPIPDLDLLIAATAKAHRLIVATLNARHFAGLEGVAVEDWAHPASNA